MECKKEENRIECTCTATTCTRRGVCCECVKHHRDRDEIPGCFFPRAVERTWDRSIANFIRSIAKAAIS